MNMRTHKPNFMYIGPTMLATGLKKNTLYQGLDSMPPQLQSLIEVTPMLSSMYVPTTNLQRAKMNLRKRGTIEFLAYQAMVKMNKAVKGTTITSNRR